MDTEGFIRHMPEVDEYRGSLNSLSERWNLLALLGQMSNIGMDMSETREGFQLLTDRLLERLGHETLVKLTSEMEAKAQVAVDILIRNLFERTADIGFLATDDDIRTYINDVSNLSGDDESRQLKKNKRQHMVERFREYVEKYSVYSNIILLNTSGRVLVQLDEENDVIISKDSLIEETLATNADYVECYRHSDLQSNQEKSLIYAFRVTETNEPDSDVLGILCLIFRFENEMDGIFKNLIEETDWMEITLLDQDGKVISSSDPYHIPIGATLPRVLDQDYKIIRFAGREYLAKTSATQGYEGFKGLGWYGHVMIPLDSAFKNNDSTSVPRVSDDMMHKVVSASTLFSDDLVDIPRQADRIQRELDITVWNGNVQIANTKSGDNSFSKTLLNEISRTGGRTKQVFEDSISNLNQTVISSYLDVAEFHASLAVDIMDRNLYERANDCRWWALTSRFREILAKAEIDEMDRSAMCEILAYINNLYTVYTNLFIFDTSGTILAVSKAEEKHLIGSKISEGWVSETLCIQDSQNYCVSPFMPSPQYNGKHTYIYGASITDIASNAVNGGIGIVFDSEPQFKQILLDALPRNDKGETISGCFSVFANLDKTIISSTLEALSVGSILDINDSFFLTQNGIGCSDIIEMNGKYYVVGSRISAGYREYKVSDKYKNDVVALVFVEIGEVSKDIESVNDNIAYLGFKYPRSQGSEDVVELSTFAVNNTLYAMESSAIVCSLSNQEITPMPGADKRCLGIISHLKKSIPIVSIQADVGSEKAYDKNNDCIIVIRIKNINDKEEIVGLVVERVVDSPEIPVRCLVKCEQVLYSGTSLTRYIVEPDQENARNQMLLVLDMDLVAQRILSQDMTTVSPTSPLLLNNPLHEVVK